MKKKLWLIIPALMLAALISSCDKDKDDDDDNNTDNEKFSTLSVEANKATIEESGLELVNTMSDMENIETVGVAINLGDILSSADMKKSFVAKESKVISTLETFVAVSKGEKKVNDLYHAMIVSGELEEDPESIKEVWDENVGTYTWNPSIEDFDIEYGGDKILVLFPSSESSMTNDASLTISNYKGVNISNPIDEEYTGDLPVSLNAELKSGSKSLVTMVFSASYDEGGVPKAVASDLTIESYKFEVDLSNTSTVASANYKFTENGNVIMEMGASGEGLFTEANIDENTTTTTKSETYGNYDWVLNELTGNYDQVWVEYTDTWEETEIEFEEIINSAEAHFQLFDIAIRGEIDVKGLMDQMRLIDEDMENEEISEDTANARGAAKINEYLNLRLVNVKTNEILAKTEAYVVKEVDPEWGYEDNYIDFRLTFGDGSHIDMETYFEDGFDDFMDEVNGLIGDINSDYDIEIDPIDY
jgi:hypothetical protein